MFTHLKSFIDNNLNVTDNKSTQYITWIVKTRCKCIGTTFNYNHGTDIDKIIIGEKKYWDSNCEVSYHYASQVLWCVCSYHIIIALTYRIIHITYCLDLSHIKFISHAAFTYHNHITCFLHLSHSSIYLWTPFTLKIDWVNSFPQHILGT